MQQKNAELIRFLIPILKHSKHYWRMITHRASEYVHCSTKRCKRC